ARGSEAPKHRVQRICCTPKRWPSRRRVASRRGRLEARPGDTAGRGGTTTVARRRCRTSPSSSTCTPRGGARHGRERRRGSPPRLAESVREVLVESRMTTDLRVVADGFHFLEGPRWRDGRLWVSDIEAGRAFRPAVLALVHPDGRVEPAADDLAFPNGTVITPDGGTLIVAETFAHRLTAFTIAPVGRLAGRRTWASLDEQVYPDGICLDAEGAIWVASPLTNEAIRV